MGAKFSNTSWNPKTLSNYNTSALSTYSNHQDPITLDYNSSEISNVIDYSEKYKPDLKIPSIFYQREKNHELESIDYLQGPLPILNDVCTKEPKIFPKLSTVDKSQVNNQNWFRIHPIKQKDVKLSDTHYWIISEPKHKRRYSARVKCNPPEMYVNAKTLFNDQFEEPDLPYDLNQQISQEYLKTHTVKRGKSENSKSYLLNMHRGLVIRMMLNIPFASEIECNSVLIGANWDFNIAEKRLKVDMLHRKGYVGQHRCIKLLEKYNWNLQEAEKQALNEFKQMQIHRQLSESQPSF